ncbi:MAG TPA: methyltransferase domain-containing protein [Pyrinomonadaceae bacterium]|jgi:SAM-dependent methyltransferase|nr:methyltransferase domain-containing protein [Pyrinomonadaceae bacterium]
MATEFIMKSDMSASQAYHEHDRGDRTAPSRSARNYYALTLLLDKLRRVVASDLLKSGDEILDYGCGNKPYRELFSGKFANYVGADISGNAEAELILDAEGRVPAGDDRFDCVLSSQVLEHVVSPRTYLREAYRVLKPEGSLVLSTHGIWPYHPDPTDFWRWTIEGLQFEIRQAGFEVTMIESVFGIESCALQLWQDSTFERLPRLIRPVYTWIFQTAIGLIERRHPRKLSNDASVYVVLARKPATAREAAATLKLES